MAAAGVYQPGRPAYTAARVPAGAVARGRQRRDDTQWPARAAGQPASGRRHGDGDGGARAGLYGLRRCGLPQPQRHPRRRHRHRRGRDQQPRRQQPPEPVPAGPPDAGPVPAGRGRRGSEPVAERIRLAGRPPPAGIGIGRGHGRCGPEPHGSPSNPRRARHAGSPSWWQSVRSGVQDRDGTHRQITPSCAGVIHRRMPPDARESPGKDCQLDRPGAQRDADDDRTRPATTGQRRPPGHCTYRCGPGPGRADPRYRRSGPRTWGRRWPRADPPPLAHIHPPNTNQTAATLLKAVAAAPG